MGREVGQMLRVLVFEEPFSVKLRLEGKLTSQTAPVLAKQWASVRGGLKGRKAILDLGDVPEVDAAGRSALHELATAGAQVGYANPKLRALIEEILEDVRGVSPLRAFVKRWFDRANQRSAGASRSEWWARLCAMLPAFLRPCRTA
jgi:ABC-type transporter Mla MlaB component